METEMARGGANGNGEEYTGILGAFVFQESLGEDVLTEDDPSGSTEDFDVRFSTGFLKGDRWSSADKIRVTEALELLDKRLGEVFDEVDDTVKTLSESEQEELSYEIHLYRGVVNSIRDGLRNEAIYLYHYRFTNGYRDYNASYNANLGIVELNDRHFRNMSREQLAETMMNELSHQFANTRDDDSHGMFMDSDILGQIITRRFDRTGAWEQVRLYLTLQRNIRSDDESVAERSRILLGHTARPYLTRPVAPDRFHYYPSWQSESYPGY